MVLKLLAELEVNRGPGCPEAHREPAPELLPLEELKDCLQMIYV
jgi:hypothetical protein